MYEDTLATGIGSGRGEHGARAARERRGTSSWRRTCRSSTSGLYFARCHPRERSYVVAGRGVDLPAGMYRRRSRPRTRSALTATGCWWAARATRRARRTRPSASRASSAWAGERFGLEPELRWATQDQMPADGVPYVGRHDPLSPGVWVATGFRKWGLAMARRRRAAGGPDRGARAPLGRAVRPEPAPAAGGRPDVREGERQRGVSLLRRPVRSAARPRCTHLGCLLDWNAAERDLGLPLSRIALRGDGEVIEGPAVARLNLLGPELARSPPCGAGRRRSRARPRGRPRCARRPA